MSKSNEAYSEAVTSGKYDRGKNFYAKYDNVRIFWEDALTRNYMKPSIARRLSTCQSSGRGLRILDMGCGSGDGFEMFLHIPSNENDLRSDTNKLIPYDLVDRYTGIDLNQDLLNQNEKRWGNDPKMSFCQGNLSQGLPDLEDNQPYDIYFAGYGTWSHLHRDETVRLLCDIVRHADDGAVIIGDWLGRFSYEWQNLWNDDLSTEQWMEYYISYIYPPEERSKVKLSPLNLRLVTQSELRSNIIEPVEKETGIKLNIDGFFDRSIFIGRHMDTSDYNPHTRPMRQYVNSLFERCQRTPLHEMMIEHHPHGSIKREDDFFRQAFNAWNYVISQCARMFYGEGNAQEYKGNTPPEFAKTIVQRFQSMIEHREFYYSDDIRADILEMHLGFMLRDLETALQQGNGNGHGLIGIFEVKK